MNFIEAVKEMKEGKKVKRESWNKKSLSLYIEKQPFSIHRFKGTDTDVLTIYPAWIEATDWEVVEEKKTLYNARNQYEFDNNWYYHEDDVKEALKEFILFCDDRVGFSGTSIVRDKAEKIFGERLLE